MIEDQFNMLRLESIGKHSFFFETYFQVWQCIQSVTVTRQKPPSVITLEEVDTITTWGTHHSNADGS